MIIGRLSDRLKVEGIGEKTDMIMAMDRLAWISFAITGTSGDMMMSAPVPILFLEGTGVRFLFLNPKPRPSGIPVPAMSSSWR